MGWLITTTCPGKSVVFRKYKLTIFCASHAPRWRVLPKLSFHHWQALKSELFLLSWHNATFPGCDITSDSPVWPMGSHAVKWTTDCQAAGQLERILGQKGLQRKKNIHQRTFTSNYQNTGWFTENFVSI